MKPKFNKMTKEQMCKLYDCSIEQLNNHFAKNANSLGKLYDKSKLTSKKVNGFTCNELKEYSEKYKNLSK